MKLDYLPPPPWRPDQKPDGTLYYLNKKTDEEMLPIKQRYTGDIHFLNMQTNAVWTSLKPDAQPVSLSVTKGKLASTAKRPSPTRQHKQHQRLFNSVPVQLNQEANSGVFKVGDIKGIEVW
jgi:hypothetical protein